MSWQSIPLHPCPWYLNPGALTFGKAGKGRDPTALAEGGVAELVRIGVDAGGGADSRAPRLNTSLHTYHVGHDVGIPLNMMLEFLRIKNQE